MIFNCLSKPPESIVINGAEYPIEWDFRAWIDVSLLAEDLSSQTDDESIKDNIEIIMKMTARVFGRIIPEPMNDVFDAIVQFIRGYPNDDEKVNTHRTSDTHEKYYSFRYDLNYIIVAIRNQSGIDLSHRENLRFHWWDFLVEFQSLTEEHHISKIIGYRAYKGKDKDMLKLKNYYALPKRYTKSEQRMIDAINDEFYNS